MYRESALLAPDLDVRDDHVVDIGAMRSGFFPSMTSGFFPEATNKEREQDPEDKSESESEPRSEVDQEVAAIAADASPIDGRRTDKIPIESSRSWSERMLATLDSLSRPTVNSGGRDCSGKSATSCAARALKCRVAAPCHGLAPLILRMPCVRWSGTSARAGNGTANTQRLDCTRPRVSGERQVPRHLRPLQVLSVA